MSSSGAVEAPTLGSGSFTYIKLGMSKANYFRRKRAIGLIVDQELNFASEVSV